MQLKSWPEYLPGSVLVINPIILQCFKVRFAALCRRRTAVCRLHCDPDWAGFTGL